VLVQRADTFRLVQVVLRPRDTLDVFLASASAAFKQAGGEWHGRALTKLTVLLPSTHEVEIGQTDDLRSLLDGDIVRVYLR
jgi:hypothetical protein